MTTSPGDNLDLDVGPLTEPQLRGLARDICSQLRRVADELWRLHKAPSDGWLIDRVEFQLGPAATDEAEAPGDGS